ncbi:hypothetical protein B5K08_25075 [Rhizobium leguminosarum bv. trifolii]|uniref:Uncharacterized protein n=1 Tax=Rhizobium leguminosarum bv. trifolii TaxID=386 RepID=A0A3E1B3W9_RHILT|nr:hypothetical protein B5K10_27320 [Rhizobium leguminosarum bv. trifolii]RFB86022.1 hypothetical protein B5K08_25075 [Rhizobium leguminosarum bv. trifolii]
MVLIPLAANDRWSLDFVSDQLTDSAGGGAVCAKGNLRSTVANVSRKASNYGVFARPPPRQHQGPHQGDGRGVIHVKLNASWPRIDLMRYKRLPTCEVHGTRSNASAC